MCFLKVKHWDGGGWRKLVRLHAKRGAHGVTRPTAPGSRQGFSIALPTSEFGINRPRLWLVLDMGCVQVCFMVINVLFQGFLRMTMRVNGGSGYNHPSPSIPLPIEGRGKPRVTRRDSLHASTAGVRA